jgi:hypothetical protein
MQSPRSRRPHGPGEKPASDGNPQPKSGGNTGHESGSSGKSKAHVPKTSPYGHHGSPVQSGPGSHPTTSPAPSQAGSPGYADSSEAKRKGGTAHQFPRGSE